jgi:hopanoid biosynthesis associated RND transporter like protein HpnN
VIERLTNFGHILLSRMVAAVCRRPAITVIVAVLLAIAAGWYSAVALRLNTSAADMISPEVPYRQHAGAYRQAFPFADNQIVVVVDAPSPDQAEAAAERLAELMRGHRDVITDVEVPSADPYFRRYGLMFLEIDALQDLATRLAGAQAALGMLHDDPSLRGLAKMLDLVLGKVGNDAPASLSDLLGRFADTTDAVAAGRPAHLSWTSLVSGAGADRLGNRRFVLARPVLDNTSFARGRPALSSVRAAIEALNGEAVGQGVEARVTGSVALRQTELDTVASSAGIATILSFVLVSAVLIAGMRSGRLIFAVLMTLVIGLMLTSGLAALVVGQLNLISVTCAVMFFGLGDDFGSHLSLRYQEELRSGIPPFAAVVAASVGVGPALTLSTLCAAIGFLSFVPTDYRGLAEFGIISGLGMGVALLVSLTVLPALIALMRPGPGVAAMEREDRGFALWVERNSRRILVVAGIGFAVSLLLLPQVRLDVNPLNLQDERTEAVRTYRDLAGKPETSPYSVNILTPNLDAAQGLADRLRGLPEVGGVRTLASYVPGDQDDKLAIIGDMALLIGPSIQDTPVPPALGPADRAAAVADIRKVVETYLNGNPPPDVAAAARRFAEALDRLSPNDAAALDAALTGGLPDLLDRLRTGLEVENPITPDDVPDSLRRRWIAPDGRARVEVQPAFDISDSRAMQTFAQPILDIAPTATGAPVTVTEGSRIVLGSFEEAVLLTVGAIVLLLLVIQRSASGIALILAPLVLAAFYTLASSAALDIPFNFANVIVIPLLFGLGVSSSIHMVARGQELARGLSPGQRFGIGLLATSTPRAVLVSTLTTSTAFATLAISPHRGLSSMGILLAIALLFTLICSLIVLPALMIEWERRRRPGTPSDGRP